MLKLYFKVIEDQNMYTKENQTKKTCERTNKENEVQTEMKYWRSAHAFTQKRKILHYKTNTLH